MCSFVDQTIGYFTVDHRNAGMTGPDVYRELTPHRVPGGKHLVADLAEFVGDAVTEFSELQMPLKNVVLLIQ